MKKLYSFLKIALWVCIGLFLVTGLYDWWYYATHPMILTSAPWYVGIQIRGVLTAGVSAILLLAMYFVRKKMK